MTRVGDWILDNPGKTVLIFLVGIFVFFTVMIILYPCESNCKSAIDIKTGQTRAPIIIPMPLPKMPANTMILP